MKLMPRISVGPVDPRRQLGKVRSDQTTLPLPSPVAAAAVVARRRRHRRRDHGSVRCRRLNLRPPCRAVAWRGFPKPTSPRLGLSPRGAIDRPRRYFATGVTVSQQSTGFVTNRGRICHQSRQGRRRFEDRYWCHPSNLELVSRHTPVIRLVM